MGHIGEEFHARAAGDLGLHPGVAHGLFGLLALGYVPDASLVVIDAALGVAHDAGVLEYPDVLAVLAAYFRFVAEGAAFEEELLHEFLALFGAQVKLFADVGHRAHQLAWRGEAQNFGQRHVGGNETPVRVDLVDAGNGVFEDGAETLLRLAHGQLGAAAFFDIGDGAHHAHALVLGHAEHGESDLDRLVRAMADVQAGFGAVGLTLPAHQFVEHLALGLLVVIDQHQEARISETVRRFAVGHLLPCFVEEHEAPHLVRFENHVGDGVDDRLVFALALAEGVEQLVALGDAALQLRLRAFEVFGYFLDLDVLLVFAMRHARGDGGEQEDKDKSPPGRRVQQARHHCRLDAEADIPVLVAELENVIDRLDRRIEDGAAQRGREFAVHQHKAGFTVLDDDAVYGIALRFPGVAENFGGRGDDKENPRAAVLQGRTNDKADLLVGGA